MDIHASLLRFPAIPALAAATLSLAPYGALLELVRTGEAADDNYGAAVAGGGDVDGDGRADHLVTAIFNDEAASAAGKVYLYLGRGAAGSDPDLAFTGEAADDQFGVSAATGGDVNGDGHADVVVGARFSDRGGRDFGAVFVHFGAPAPGAPGGMDSLADWVLVGEAADDWFGHAVDVAGDVNGDGYDDVVVGAPFSDAVGANAGRAYLYFGGESPDAVPDVLLAGDPQDDNQFGWSVSRAGDVNGDGYGDVIVGARLFGSGPTRARGRAYVFLGGPAPDGVPDVVLTGERRDDWFGNTVSEVGDFNRDGYDDVAVGAIFWDDLSDPLLPRSAAGKVYVFHGGAPMDDLPDWTASGEAQDDQFGFSLAPAGDVDGNGGGDLLVGARFADDLSGPVRLNAGKVYLFLGSSGAAPPGATAALVRAGAAADDHLGHAVASAGDGNGDGLSEVLLGAHFADEGGSGSGSATLVRLDCLDLEVSAAELVWGGCGAHASYEIRRGDPGGFPAGQFGSCVASHLASPPASDPEDPPPGAIFSYLVAGRGAGPQATVGLGFGSDGTGRPAPAPCP